MIFGLVVLCFSPRLVAWSIASKRKSYRWLLRRFGLGDTALATLPEESPWLGKWERFANWVGVLVLAGMFLLIGVATLLQRVTGRGSP